MPQTVTGADLQRGLIIVLDVIIKMILCQSWYIFMLFLWLQEERLVVRTAPLLLVRCGRILPDFLGESLQGVSGNHEEVIISDTLIPCIL